MLRRRKQPSSYYTSVAKRVQSDYHKFYRTTGKDPTHLFAKPSTLDSLASAGVTRYCPKHDVMMFRDCKVIPVDSYYDHDDVFGYRDQT